MVFVVVFLSFLPSYFCGASFLQPFTYFSKQLGEYTSMTLGCANMWHLFGVKNMDDPNLGFNIGGTILSLLMIGIFMAILYLRKIRLTDENLVYIAVFLISIVPFFLPHMHERYLYCFEGLVVLYSVLKKRRYYFVPLLQISGGIAYYHYMSGFSKYFIDALGEDSVSIAAGINLFVLGILFYDLMKLSHISKEEDLKNIQEEKEVCKNLLNKTEDSSKSVEEK